MEQLLYLKSELTSRLTRLEQSVAWYRSRHYWSQMSTVILSSLTAILAGMKTELISPAVSSNLILALSSLATVISAWGAFFNPRESWHLSAETYSELRALQTRIQFLESQPKFEFTSEMLESFYEEYQNIVDKFNSKWLALRQRTGERKSDRG